MNWYLIVKFLHILAVTITIGGMLARQIVRSIARKSDDVMAVTALTHVVTRLDRGMVIPWSNIMIIVGIILAVMQKWPILGFFTRLISELAAGIQYFVGWYDRAYPCCVYSPQ